MEHAKTILALFTTSLIFSLPLLLFALITKVLWTRLFSFHTFGKEGIDFLRIKHSKNGDPFEEKRFCFHWKILISLFCVLIGLWFCIFVCSMLLYFYEISKFRFPRSINLIFQIFFISFPILFFAASFFSRGTVRKKMHQSILDANSEKQEVLPNSFRVYASSDPNKVKKYRNVLNLSLKALIVFFCFAYTIIDFSESWFYEYTIHKLKLKPAAVLLCIASILCFVFALVKYIKIRSRKSTVMIITLEGVQLCKYPFPEQILPWSAIKNYRIIKDSSSTKVWKLELNLDTEKENEEMIKMVLALDDFQCHPKTILDRLKAYQTEAERLSDTTASTANAQKCET